MFDLMEKVPNKTIDCLDYGFVRLVDCMPRLVPDESFTADYAICQAARVSYQNGTKTVNEDKGLIKYLMRHSHTSPFELVTFKLHLKMPIFVARQWIRHRTCSMNEISARYSVMKDEFYIPKLENVRAQSKTNKQGGTDQVEKATADDFVDYLDSLCDETYADYTKYIEDGVSREQARMLLPVNLYTEFYWQMNLHNLLHFIALRSDPHAQWEIRVFSDAILELIKPIVPWTVEAWEDYHPMRGAIKLTRLEVEALKKHIENMGHSIGAMEGNTPDFPEINSDNKREKAEWAEKASKLGIL